MCHFLQIYYIQCRIHLSCVLSTVTTTYLDNSPSQFFYLLHFLPNMLRIENCRKLKLSVFVENKDQIVLHSFLDKLC